MSARNLQIGKGKLYFAPFATGTQTPGGERWIGNCPQVNLSREDELLDHFSSTEGVRQKDEQVTVETMTKGTVECDDVSKENLAILFCGTADVLSVGSTSGVEETFEAVQQGLEYQLGVTTAAPSGARKVASVVVTGSGGSPTYVAGTDYTVDLTLARITILASGDIEDDDDIEVAYNISASTRERVISGDQQIEGSLRWIANNPKGKNFDFFWPWVKLSPNGDYTLVTDGEFVKVPFSIEALKKDGMNVQYVDGRPA
jgi:hypothetical protein